MKSNEMNKRMKERTNERTNVATVCCKCRSAGNCDECHKTEKQCQKAIQYMHVYEKLKAWELCAAL